MPVGDELMRIVSELASRVGRLQDYIDLRCKLLVLNRVFGYLAQKRREERSGHYMIDHEPARWDLSYMEQVRRERLGLLARNLRSACAKLDGEFPSDFDELLERLGD